MSSPPARQRSRWHRPSVPSEASHFRHRRTRGRQYQGFRRRRHPAPRLPCFDSEGSRHRATGAPMRQGGRHWQCSRRDPRCWRFNFTTRRTSDGSRSPSRKARFPSTCPTVSCPGRPDERARSRGAHRLDGEGRPRPSRQLGNGRGAAGGGWCVVGHLVGCRRRLRITRGEIGGTARHAPRGDAGDPSTVTRRSPRDHAYGRSPARRGGGTGAGRSPRAVAHRSGRRGRRGCFPRRPRERPPPHRHARRPLVPGGAYSAERKERRRSDSRSIAALTSRIRAS